MLATSAKMKIRNPNGHWGRGKTRNLHIARGNRNFFLQGVMQKSSTLQMGENLLTLKNMYSSFQLRLNDNTIA
jgi:hypothetical protein